MVFYGLNGSIVGKQDLDMLSCAKVPKQQVCFMEKDITDQGVRLSQILQPEEGIAATCVDLTVLKAMEAPGVSEPNPLVGLSKD